MSERESTSESNEGHQKDTLADDRDIVNDPEPGQSGGSRQNDLDEANSSTSDDDDDGDDDDDDHHHPNENELDKLCRKIGLTDKLKDQVAKKGEDYIKSKGELECIIETLNELYAATQLTELPDILKDIGFKDGAIFKLKVNYLDNEQYEEDSVYDLVHRFVSEAAVRTKDGFPYRDDLRNVPFKVELGPAYSRPGKKPKKITVMNIDNAETLEKVIKKMSKK